MLAHPKEVLVVFAGLVMVEIILILVSTFYSQQVEMLLLLIQELSHYLVLKVY